MTRTILAAALLTALAGCNSLSERSSGDFGSSIGSGFVRNGDTNGTQRRVDVYSGSNSPVLPTIGAPGYGK